MRRIFLAIAIIFATTITLCAQDEVKRVAILKTVDEAGNVPLGVKLNLRSTLAYAISHMSGYEAYTRVNISEIMDEQKFQRTGYVSDSQIKKLGEMTGASYVLVAEAAYYDENNIVVTATIIDVETARIKESSQPEIASIEPSKMRESCIQIARTLLGKDNNANRPSPPNRGVTAQQGQDYTETALGINMRMIYVEGGTFNMGCADEYGTDCTDDVPKPRRTSVSPFYIGMLEVTQRQWFAVMKDYPYNDMYDYYKILSGKEDDSSGMIYTELSQIGPSYPMYYVPMHLVDLFLSILSEKTGKNYRLPTEAEWEYAARGGNKSSGTRYAGSNNISDVAWYGNNSDSSVHICGSLKPNILGLYDMSGNVAEWCSDFYENSYLQYDTINPTGPEDQDPPNEYVVRGGCWYFNESSCRIYDRMRAPVYLFDSGIGFRVACDVPNGDEHNRLNSFGDNSPEQHNPPHNDLTPPRGNAVPQQKSEIITITVGNVSFDMVKVEAGSFVMGCTSEQESECYNGEQPYHRVTITQDYYIGKFEVTQALYETVMGYNPSTWKAYNQPVETVSWDDAQKFCKKLSLMTGHLFSLPTEAEWEYAARGGKKSAGYIYSGSNNEPEVAWTSENSGEHPHPVGQLRPNELGIYDMSGNVTEWCMDWYGNYDSKNQIDPTGPASNQYGDRVVRGGVWDGGYGVGCVTRRSRNTHNSGYDRLGFRIVSRGW